MKKLVGISIGLCLCLGGFAQSSLVLEYFIDNDPGFGEATPVLLDTLSSELNIPLAGISHGFHRLYTRVYDPDTKRWSHTLRRNFYAKSAPESNQIAGFVYYFGRDSIQTEPDTFFLGEPARSVEVEFSPNLDSLIASGLHQLCIAAISVEGKVSAEVCEPITISGISTSQRSLLDESIQMFPTFAQELIYLKVETSTLPKYQIKIIDSQGKLMLYRPSLKTGHLEISVNGWTPGTYFALVESKGAIWVNAFVVGR